MTLAAGCTAGTKRMLARDGGVRRGARAVRAADRRLRDHAAQARAHGDRHLRGRRDARRAGAARRASPEGEYALEAACCKVFASEMLWRAADEMVQIAGGRGFVKPYPYERLLRDARINRIFEGTNEILRLFIALNGIQEPAERAEGARRRAAPAAEEPRPDLRVRGVAAARAGSAPRRRSTSTLHERLQAHKEYFEKHVAELKDATRARDPRVPEGDRRAAAGAGAAGDMAIELFATACVLARTQQLLEERGEDGVRARARRCATCSWSRRGAGSARAGSAIQSRAGRDAARRGARCARRRRLRRGRARILSDDDRATSGRPSIETTSCRIYDVSLPAADGGLVYPGNPPISITPQQAISQGAGANVSRLDFGSHTGTHVDAPKHFFDDGAGVDALPLDVLMGPARADRLRRRGDEHRRSGAARRTT